MRPDLHDLLEVSRALNGDDQQVMARWTGSYRHGNERQTRQHGYATAAADGHPSGSQPSLTRITSLPRTWPSWLRANASPTASSG